MGPENCDDFLSVEYVQTNAIGTSWDIFYI